MRKSLSTLLFLAFLATDLHAERLDPVERAQLASERSDRILVELAQGLAERRIGRCDVRAEYEGPDTLVVRVVTASRSGELRLRSGWNSFATVPTDFLAQSAGFTGVTALGPTTGPAKISHSSISRVGQTETLKQTFIGLNEANEPVSLEVRVYQRTPDRPQWIHRSEWDLHCGRS
jgi:hypothetical protein